MKIQLDNQDLNRAIIEYVLNHYNVPYSGEQIAVTITAQNNNFTAVVDTEPPQKGQS